MFCLGVKPKPTGTSRKSPASDAIKKRPQQEKISGSFHRFGTIEKSPKEGQPINGKISSLLIQKDDFDENLMLFHKPRSPGELQGQTHPKAKSVALTSEMKKYHVGSLRTESAAIISTNASGEVDKDHRHIFDTQSETNLWECLQCTYQNIQAHLICEICRQTRPVEQTEEVWICVHCTCENSVDDSTCTACGSRPASTRRGAHRTRGSSQTRKRAEESDSDLGSNNGRWLPSKGGQGGVTKSPNIVKRTNDTLSLSGRKKSKLIISDDEDEEAEWNDDDVDIRFDQPSARRSSTFTSAITSTANMCAGSASKVVSNATNINSLQSHQRSVKSSSSGNPIAAWNTHTKDGVNEDDDDIVVVDDWGGTSAHEQHTASKFNSSSVSPSELAKRHSKSSALEKCAGHPGKVCSLAPKLT